MKKILPIIIALAILGGGGYFALNKFAPSALDKMPSSTTTPGSGTEMTMENADARDLFIKTRGIPNMYLIVFSDAEINQAGEPLALEEMARTESWTFGDPINAISNFKNGFFVEENKIEDSLPLMKHEISPLSFTADSKIDDVVGLMGEADCEVSGEAGPHSVRTLKYSETETRPYASFSFSGEQIIAATVGIAFKEDSSSETLCQ